jgi:hypothetical protein
MLDFSKLRVPTKAERDADDRRRQAQAIADDTARRQIRATKSVEMTLNSDAECRFTTSGERVVHLRGVQHNGRIVRAQWFAPHHLGREEYRAIFNALLQGVSVKLDGYWKPFAGAGGTNFTFMAQFFEINPS